MGALWVKAPVILLPVFGGATKYGSPRDTHRWILADCFFLSPVFVSVLALYGKTYEPIPTH